MSHWERGRERGRKREERERALSIGLWPTLVPASLLRYVKVATLLGTLTVSLSHWLKYSRLSLKKKYSDLRDAEHSLCL